MGIFTRNSAESSGETRERGGHRGWEPVSAESSRERRESGFAQAFFRFFYEGGMTEKKVS